LFEQTKKWTSTIVKFDGKRKENNTNKTLCAYVIEKKAKKKHEQTTDMNKTNKVRYTKKKRTSKRDMTIVYLH